jgi:hypothetical protein
MMLKVLNLVSAGNGKRRARQRDSSLEVDQTLELSSIEGVSSSPGFVFSCLFFKILAFVPVGFPFPDTDLDLDSMIFPVEPKGDEGLAFYGGGFEKLGDFGFVKQQLARSFRVVLLVAGALVRLNIGVVEECLLILNTRERVVEIGEAGTNRLHLCAGQTNAGLDLFQDLIIMKCSPI